MKISWWSNPCRSCFIVTFTCDNYWIYNSGRLKKQIALTTRMIIPKWFMDFIGVECLWPDQISQDHYRITLVVFTFVLPLILVITMYSFIANEIFFFMNKNPHLWVNSSFYYFWIWEMPVIVLISGFAFLICLRWIRIKCTKKTC